MLHGRLIKRAIQSGCWLLVLAVAGCGDVTPSDFRPDARSDGMRDGGHEDADSEPEEDAGELAQDASTV